MNAIRNGIFLSSKNDKHVKIDLLIELKLIGIYLFNYQARKAILALNSILGVLLCSHLSQKTKLMLSAHLSKHAVYPLVTIYI